MSVVADFTALGRLSINQFFNRGRCLRSGTASPWCFDFEAVESRRIMGGSNHDAASCLEIFDSPGNKWCWLRFGK
jgi:hypothetical protein